MNKALKSALLELKREGISLDPIEDLDHILTLHALAERITNPPPVPGDRAVDEPVLAIGDAVLRPLSIGARRWLTERAARWFPGDSALQDLAYAFAMAHPPETLWAIEGRCTCFMALWDWERGLGCSLKALRAALADFLGTLSTEDGRKPGPGDYRAAVGLLDGWRPLPVDYKAGCMAALASLEIEAERDTGGYGPLIELLVREYGQTPEHWLWRVPERDINMLLEARSERIDREERATSGKVGDSRMVRAHHAFTQYLDLVRKAKGKA
jgi:hypothetical protein